MNNQTILITGGAGFIGSHVNKMLQEAGYKTIVYDNLCRGDRRAVLNTPFIQGDIGDEQTLDHVFKYHSVHAVMHFAAFIDVGESIADPTIYYRNNVCNTLSLLRVMLRNEVKIIIFSSSASIFGYPQTPLIAENHPCCPINPYGSTKWMIEQILRDFDHAYGLKSCCLRYFNAAGGDPEGKIKNYSTRHSNLIPIILNGLKTNQSFTIFGTDYPTPDGTCIRDYIHIEDLATAHLLGLKDLLRGGSSCCYNLGNGHGYSVREVIRAVESATGLSVKFKEGQRRPGDPPKLVADAKKAFLELDWKPRYPKLETIIEHAWNALEPI